jgi:hypothetical protein
MKKSCVPIEILRSIGDLSNERDRNTVKKRQSVHHRSPMPAVNSLKFDSPVCQTEPSLRDPSKRQPSELIYDENQLNIQ